MELKDIADTVIGKEAFNAVVSINDEIDFYFWNDKSISEKDQKRLEEDYYNYKLEFMSDGNAFAIEFLGAQLWNSENDEREYDDREDDYAESISVYVYRKMVEAIRDLELVTKYLLEKGEQTNDR
jgi:hypothetical protein